jgi:hypothetical protein
MMACGMDDGIRDGTNNKGWRRERESKKGTEEEKKSGDREVKGE